MTQGSDVPHTEGEVEEDQGWQHLCALIFFYDEVMPIPYAETDPHPIVGYDLKQCSQCSRWYYVKDNR